MSEKKQIRAGNEIEPVRPGKAGSPDKSQDEPKFPSGVDQDFVYYEE